MFDWLSKSYFHENESEFAQYDIKYQGEEYIFYGKMRSSANNYSVSFNFSTETLLINTDSNNNNTFSVYSNYTGSSSSDLANNQSRQYPLLTYCIKNILRQVHPELYGKLPKDIQIIQPYNAANKANQAHRNTPFTYERDSVFHECILAYAAINQCETGYYVTGEQNYELISSEYELISIDFEPCSHLSICYKNQEVCSFIYKGRVMFAKLVELFASQR